MTFDRQPTLTGPTITLRPLTADDHDALARAASDPLVWEQHPSNRHEPEEFDAYFDDALASGGALVAETRDGTVIGSSRFHGYDERAASVEIGWTFLARSHWGGTTNREMKKLMLDHAFATVDRVFFFVAPDNHRSQRAVEKLGATRLPEPGHDGYVAFELTREAWHADPGGH